MRGLVSNVIVVFTAMCALAGCGGAGGSLATPQTSQNSKAPTAEAAARLRMATLVRTKIKHIFVIVQENHTFDQLFGLYPAMNGNTVENLSTALAQDVDCQYDTETGSCQRPFLISTNKNSPNYVADAPDINGGDNSRFGQEVAIDRGKMDDFLVEDEAGQPVLGPTPTPQQVEQHNEDLAIEGVYDCDAVPYLWDYAQNFALFDHYFQAGTGPSSPSNVQLFAGQIGQTEAAAGEGTLSEYYSGGYTDGVPLSNDDNPPASELPFSVTSYTGDSGTFQSYATMPILLSPRENRVAKRSRVVGYEGRDIAKEAAVNRPSYPWAWYEEGLYNSNAGFVAHHAAPLYFDYINNANSAYASQQTLRDNTESNGLISDISSGKLPKRGVFWVKGGVKNTYGLAPADPIFTDNTGGKDYYVGDDDHPGSGDADHQVAQAYLAEMINAIAKSKYWKDSVILVTWDDSGGFFDHLAPTEVGSTCPQDRSGPEEGYSCGEGVRVPMLVISPFAKTDAVVNDFTDHGSVSKFIESVFALPTFASLPDEAKGVKAGLSPADGDQATSNLFDALDESKLEGSGENPPYLAEISSPSVPPKQSCSSLGITPVASPASLPVTYSGSTEYPYETSGYYLHQELAGSHKFVRLPPRKEDND
ncbi:MAG: alkaline phosphatase family protein [Candidatus Cybelea sp.]